MGPTRGSAKVYVDGKLAATVSLYATAFRPTRVLFKKRGTRPASTASASSRWARRDIRPWRSMRSSSVPRPATVDASRRRLGQPDRYADAPDPAPSEQPRSDGRRRRPIPPPAGEAHARADATPTPAPTPDADAGSDADPRSDAHTDAGADADAFAGPDADAAPRACRADADRDACTHADADARCRRRARRRGRRRRRRRSDPDADAQADADALRPCRRRRRRPCRRRRRRPVPTPTPTPVPTPTPTPVARRRPRHRADTRADARAAGDRLHRRVGRRPERGDDHVDAQHARDGPGAVRHDVGLRRLLDAGDELQLLDPRADRLGPELPGRSITSGSASTNAAGVTVTSGDQTFTTLAAPAPRRHPCRRRPPPRCRRPRRRRSRRRPPPRCRATAAGRVVDLHPQRQRRLERQHGRDVVAPGLRRRAARTAR